MRPAHSGLNSAVLTTGFSSTWDNIVEVVNYRHRSC